MSATVRRGALYALTALALALPGSARAETGDPVRPNDPPTSTAMPMGPTAAAAAVGVQARHEAAAPAATAQSRAGLGKPRALMFVGLGTFIAGAIIGGEAGAVIMVTGAAIGLYGLYHYLQ